MKINIVFISVIIPKSGVIFLSLSRSKYNTVNYYFYNLKGTFLFKYILKCN